MSRKFLFAILLVTAMFVIGGCSTGTDSVGDDVNLEDFGAYKATDEEPFFGDADLAELSTAEENEFDDPAAFSPAIVEIENDTVHRANMFSFRMIWGNLNHDSNITELTDWSGKLTLSFGHLVVTHTIRFEAGQDYVQPRITLYPPPPVIHWTSQTAGHFDGLATKILIPYLDERIMMPEKLFTVTYESEQLSITFTFDQLEELDTLINIGHGNAISFQAMRFEPRTEIHGGLIGRWGRSPGGVGFFYGLWRASNGRLMGSLRGHWGTNDDGRQIFLGKWIDSEGRFRGFVRGNWADGYGYDRTEGQFNGQIYNAEREPMGLLAGHYKKGDNHRGGFFAGRWCVGCQPMISNDGS